MLVAPHSGAGDEEGDQAANPTEFLLLLGPMKTDLETVGIVEVFQRTDAGPSTQRLSAVPRADVRIGGRFPEETPTAALLPSPGACGRNWKISPGWSTRSLDPRFTAYTIANEGRRLIECDRVSVAICKGRSCVIEAISGQDFSTSARTPFGCWATWPRRSGHRRSDVVHGRHARHAAAGRRARCKTTSTSRIPKPSPCCR